MSRISIKPPGWERVTPKWDDNHQDDDPVTCEVRDMPNGVRSAWNSHNIADDDTDVGEEKERRKARRAKTRMAVLEGDAPNEAMTATSDQVRLVIDKCVRDVRDYDDHDGLPIRSGLDLFLRGEPGFVEELYWMIVMRTMMRATTAKNSSGRPGSQ